MDAGYRCKKSNSVLRVCNVVLSTSILGLKQPLPKMCAFLGEDGVPRSSCYETSLIPSNVLLNGVANSFSCLLCSFLSAASLISLITRNWILTRSGETHLLLAGSLQFAAGKWICWSLFQNSGCSQPFSWKILQFKRKLVCLPISESVWNDRSMFSQTFSLQLLNLQIWAEVEILLALGAGDWRRMPCVARLVNRLCASDTINLYNCVHFSCATVTKMKINTT